MQAITIEAIKSKETRKQVQALIDLGGTATTEELATVLEEPNAKVISGRFTALGRTYNGCVTYNPKTGYTWTGVTDTDISTLDNHKISDPTRKQVQALIDLGGTATSEMLAEKLNTNDRLSIRNRFIALNKMYPKAVAYDRKTGYTWTGNANDIFKEEQKVVDVKAKEVPEVKPESKPEPKSSTGYPDPTAFQALLDAEAKKVVSPKYHPGDIWEYQRAYYNKNTPIGELYFILGAFPGTNTVLKLVELDEMYDGRYDMLIDVKGKTYYVDPRRVESRAERGFCRRVDCVKPYHLETIRKLVGATLGVRYVETKTVTEVVEKKVEVPVEKIVEKVVEKRVEVPVEEPGTVRIDATEYALLKQRADLWERAFKMVAGK